MFLTNKRSFNKYMTTTLSYLESKDGFVEGNKSDAAAKLEIEERGKAELTFSPGVGLITRRKASRQAESVCKSGFLMASGERIGIGSKLDVVEGDPLGEAHLREGYKYNRY